MQIDLSTSRAAGETLRQLILASKEEEGLIKLSSRCWPQLTSSVLFVRYFFKDCFEGVLRRGDVSGGGKHRKFIVTGAGGIGKSAFGLYCLWRALRSSEKRAVIYVNDLHNHAWVFQGDGTVKPFRKSDLEELPELDQPSTLLITDSMESTPSVRAFTIFITSPARQRWRQLSTLEDCLSLVFPVFSEAEVERMRQSCFPDVPKEEANERFKKWGGIPRYVLAKVDTSSQAMLQSALTSLQPETVWQLLKEDGHAPSIGQYSDHGLLHLKNKGEAQGSLLSPAVADWYQLDKSELASSYVKQAVHAAAFKEGYLQQHPMLRVPEMMNAQQTARKATDMGPVFEEYALQLLAKGGSFPVRALTADGKGGEALLQLPSAPEIPFSSVADLSVKVGSLRDPQNFFFRPPRSFAAIDAVLPGLRLSNCTISGAHDIVLGDNGKDGLFSIASACGIATDEQVHFYWVVPKDQFQGSSWRSPKPFTALAGNSAHLSTGNGSKAGSLPQGLQQFASRVKQWVLCLPFVGAPLRHEVAKTAVQVKRTAAKQAKKAPAAKRKAAAAQKQKPAASVRKKVAKREKAGLKRAAHNARKVVVAQAKTAAQSKKASAQRAERADRKRKAAAASTTFPSSSPPHTRAQTRAQTRRAGSSN